MTEILAAQCPRRAKRGARNKMLGVRKGDAALADLAEERTEAQVFDQVVRERIVASATFTPRVRNCQ